MGAIGIACQTITWGDEQTEFMDRVVRVAADAGYAALEVGYRRLAGVDPGELKELLRQHGISIVATHIGGNLEDREQAEGEHTMVDVVLDCILDYGGSYVMYSGLRYEDDEQFSAAVDTLNRSARTCADRGIRLLYHNHDWEFRGASRVIDRLLDLRVPELGFCPDIGWVVKGGGEPLDFLRAAGDATPAVHFKDFATGGSGMDAVCLGDGVVPFEEVADWIRGNESHVDWVVAEQDSAQGCPDEAVTRNGAYLKALFSAPAGSSKAARG